MVWKLWIRIRMTKIRVFRIAGMEYDWILFRKYPFRSLHRKYGGSVAFGFGFLGWTNSNRMWEEYWQRVGQDKA